MFPTTSFFASLAGLLALLPAARAGFNPNSEENISVYWGQNSFGHLGWPEGQQRLSFYCETEPSINIIPLGFLYGIENPTIDFANADNNCTAIAGTGLMTCPQIEADIQECQSTYGKTILLSIGGATYSEGGFSSSSAAVAAAQNVWAMFGPVQSGSSAIRPFGTAVVDGFDFDFESTVTNVEPFVAELRTLINAATDKKYYLSAAPQCPYPDLSDESFINGEVSFDWVQVQFYNNYCEVANYANINDWDFSTWDTWAKTVSANPDAKVLMGIPGNTGGANAGSYASGTQLANAIANAKSYSRFGGIMVWDMSQLQNNPGFLDQVVSDLGAAAASPAQTTTTTKTSPTALPTTTTKATTLTTITTTKAGTPTSSAAAATTTTKATTLTTVSTKASTPSTSSAAAAAATNTASSSGGLPQWAQCGGQGYTGPTNCAAPYTCVASGVWWSQCQ